MKRKQAICLATSILVLAMISPSCIGCIPSPDLVWTGNLTLDPSTPVVGDKFIIKQTWRNAGSSAISSEFDIRLEIREGNYFTVFDQYIRVRQPVAPGEERTIDITPEYVFPELGIYQVVLTLDAKEVVAESREDNNVTESDLLEVFSFGGDVIILNAYDSGGNLLSYTDFREVTNDEAIATDLNNLPYYGSLDHVPVGYSAEVIPAFGVVPQTPYKIHVLWEVPGFGKVMLSADNESKGYSVDSLGGKLTLNFNYEAAKSKLAMLERDYDLFQNQGYSISGSVGEGLTLSKKHLELAEDYLMLTPTPDMGRAVAELSLSLKHSLWAHEQLHLDRAKADIEKYRKGSVKLKVVDVEDKPLSDCNVSFQQVSHDFLFGANPLGKWYNYDPRRASLLREAGINYSYIIAPWRGIEPSPGKFDWGVIDTHQDIQAQLEQEFKLMGDCTLWFIRNGVGGVEGDEHCPHYLDNMTFEELKQHVYDHMYALASRYKDKIKTWEIYGANHGNPLGLTWDQNLEIYKIFAEAVTDANREAKIIYASQALPYQWNRPRLEDTSAKAQPLSYLEFMSLLMEKQIPIDIIGVELYYSGVMQDNYVSPGLDMVAVSEILDQYSSFGKPVFLREVSAPSVQVPGSCWWHRPWDEQTQAEYLEKLYTIAFAKPLLHELCWSFGISDDEAFMTGGGLLDADSNPKQSFHALKKLIKSWTTSGTGFTDEKGQISFRGFGGSYEVVITDPETGLSKKQKINIEEQKNNQITIVLD